MADLQAELRQSVDQAQWDWLMPHADRGAVIVVGSGLSLVDVGVAIAQDDTAIVQQWIADCQIYKPSASQKLTWDQAPGTCFQALIVQPYVLIQGINPDASLNPPPFDP